MHANFLAIFAMVVIAGLVIFWVLGSWIIGVAVVLTLLFLGVLSGLNPDVPVSLLTRRDVERILEEAIETLERGEAPVTPAWKEFINGNFEDLALQLAQDRCVTCVLMDELEGPIVDLEEAAEILRFVLKELRTHDEPL